MEGRHIAHHLQRTFSVIYLPYAWPILLIDREIGPSLMPLASFHSSMAGLIPSPFSGIENVPWVLIV